MYDNMGMFSVARAAWMMKFFGASDVRILDGGMKKWLSEDKPTAKGP
jgi:thiosulfate/3-mercaptopyruvate sulfurtransferase